MFQALVFEYSHRCGTTDTVVGTQSSLVGSEPFAVDDSLYRVGFEIVFHFIVFLRHHIEVRLKHYHLTVFHSGRGRLAYHNITDFVGSSLQSERFTEIYYKFCDVFQVMRRVRNRAYLLEVTPYSSGF